MFVDNFCRQSAQLNLIHLTNISSSRSSIIMKTEMQRMEERTRINFLLNPFEEENNSFRLKCATEQTTTQHEVTQPKISNLVESTFRLTINPQQGPPANKKIPQEFNFHSHQNMLSPSQPKMTHMEITKDPKIVQLEAEISQLEASCQSKLSQQHPTPMEFHINTILKNNKKKQMKTMIIKEKYLLMRQTEAAYQLGFSSSTFSKRWRDSVPLRKWPYRKNSKLSNAIKVLRSMQKKSNQDHYDSNKSHVENELARLVKERSENLRPAVIYYYDKDMTKVKKEEIV